MATEKECATAWARVRKAMDEAGIVLIHSQAIAEIQRYEEDVECPHCTAWNHVSVVPDEEKTVRCTKCRKSFEVSLVRYIVAQ